MNQIMPTRYRHTNRFNRVLLTMLVGLIITACPGLAWAGLEGRVREVLLAADLRETQVAVLAVDLTSGEELAAIDADEPMIPASNMKLITSAAAVHILGLDYTFRTQLRLIHPRQSAPPPGAVPGDSGQDTHATLVVVGDGDPGFCDPVLLDEHEWDVEQLLGVWTRAIREAGVQRVGRLIVDDRVFDRQLVHPDWPKDQLHKWYCAQVAGLNFYDNCLDVYPEPTKLGYSPRMTVLPAVPFLNPASRATTGNSDSFWISREPRTNKLTLWGTVKHQRATPVQVTVHDPPMLFAKILADRLGQIGIEVDQISRPQWEDRLPEGQTLHVVQTTLPVVLRRCNKDSQNLFAEALFKRIGRKFTGSAGSWENGAAAVRFFLQDQLGAHGAAVTIKDGSGLSKENRVTARVLVELLKKTYQHPDVWPVMRDSLSVGGEDGTLRRRFKRGGRGRVYAKSGYVKGVSALSGYLVVPPPSQDGGEPHEPSRVIVFSCLFNGIKPPVYVHKVKKVQEDLIRIFERVASSQSAKAKVPGDD